MSEQKIKTFNLRKEKGIKEFFEVSRQELIKINKELTKYKTGIIQKKILIILLNYEKKHHKMMNFDDIGVATNYNKKFSGLFFKRLTELENLGLIDSYFNDETKSFRIRRFSKKDSKSNGFIRERV